MVSRSVSNELNFVSYFILNCITRRAVFFFFNWIWINLTGLFWEDCNVYLIICNWIHLMHFGNSCNLLPSLLDRHFFNLMLWLFHSNLRTQCVSSRLKFLIVYGCRNDSSEMAELLEIIDVYFYPAENPPALVSLAAVSLDVFAFFW